MKQMCILVWKNLLIRKNCYIATALETLLPIALLALINTSLSNQEKIVDNDPISFEAFKAGECSQRHGHFSSIIYEPSTPFLTNLMTLAACYAGYRKTSVKPGSLSNNNTYFSIGVKFENTKESLESIRVLNYTLFPFSKAFVNLENLWRHHGTSIPRYSIPSMYDVVELQRAIDASYLHLKNIHTPKFLLENTDVHDRTPRVFIIAVFVTLFIAFSLMVPPIVSRIVQEKYTGAKELMLMMGVIRWKLWVAKFLDVIIVVNLTVIIMVVFLCVPLRSDSSYIRISPLLFWSVIMYGLIGTILFLFCMSCFFDKPTMAVYISELIWCASFILSFPVDGFVQLPKFVKYLYFCVFPHVSLMEGVRNLIIFDTYDKEIKLTERLSGRENAFSLLDVLLTTTMSILLYSVLIWYFEQVKPGRYGVPLPYNFCFKKSYWVPRKVAISCSYDTAMPRDNFEPVSVYHKPGVHIENVTKVYKSSDKGAITAVENVCLDFYSREISGLLGHNGAGKTTLFSMITGLSYPTSGKIMINGYDLSINVREARRSFGFCPQQDMLFNNLTAVESLQFYGVVKGLSLKEAQVEADELITKLKLTNVKCTQACKLSGGQKRKVSLAIALIGGSQFLVLDEPTAGMDPEIRREIWEILLGCRSERTILLTTHFMEEADALCDRIAIMDHGKIKCYGSPMFLKSKYGKGYVLSVVVHDTDKSKELFDYIKQFVAAKPKSQNIRTLHFQLPESEVSNFARLFSGLDEKQAAGEIISYSISFSTLEDAFLRLRSGHKETDDFDITDYPVYKELDIDEDPNKEKSWKSAWFLNALAQFWVLIIKKWIYFQRSYITFLLYCVFLPGLTEIFAYSFSNSNHEMTKVSSRSLTYSLDLYPSSLVLYSMPKHMTFEKSLLERLVESSGSKAMQVNDTKEAIYEIYEDDFHKYARKVILAFDISPDDFRIYHNTDAVHMVPVAINFFHNYLLKSWYANDSIVTSLSASYISKTALPLLIPTDKCKLNSVPDFWGFQTMFYLSGPVKERFYGAKGLQLMVTSSLLYWLSHLVFDVITFAFYLIPLLIVTGVAGDATVLKYPGEMFLAFFFWGTGLILIQYLLSTFITNTTIAFTISIFVYVFFTYSAYTTFVSEGPLFFLKIFHPSPTLKLGIEHYCSGNPSIFYFDLLMYCCTCLILLFIIDSQILSRGFRSVFNRFFKRNYGLEGEKDELVKEEEELVGKLVKGKKFSAYGLVVHNLRHWYFRRPSPAVRGISFAVKRGECFGLLGVNGAGKTTTFKILTGTFPPSQGSTYACSEELSLFNKQKYLFSIGYCPQFGGLIPIFKGSELLTFFARLRGAYRPLRVKEEVLKWLEKMDLLEYAHEKCGSYSGGNQRKLSTAIALIGNCPLIFLDEPTTGVDPLSRRAIWNVIRDVQKEGQSVVLTSHSMDECEALCSRLAIMVKGQFRCLGETTTLKERFGRGYSVQLKLSNKAAEGDVVSLKNSVAEAFHPGCKLVDDHLTLLQYHVTNEHITWQNLFTKLNQFKDNFHILESYTASATTLEQIFIQFARSAGETV